MMLLHLTMMFMETKLTLAKEIAIATALPRQFRTQKWAQFCLHMHPETCPWHPTSFPFPFISLQTVPLRLSPHAVTRNLSTSVVWCSHSDRLQIDFKSFLSVHLMLYHAAFFTKIPHETKTTLQQVLAHRVTDPQPRARAGAAQPPLPPQCFRKRLCQGCLPAGQPLDGRPAPARSLHPTDTSPPSLCTGPGGVFEEQGAAAASQAWL